MSFMHHSYLTEMVLTSIVSVVRHMCVKLSYKRGPISGHKSVVPGELVEGISTSSMMARTLSKMTLFLIPLLAMVSYEIVDRQTFFNHQVLISLRQHQHLPQA